MGKFQNLLFFPVAYFRIIRNLSKQKQFIHTNLIPLLDNTFPNIDNKVTEKDIFKIKNYYGLAVPAILGEAICALRGFGMTETERWVSTSQGVITGLFDDFIDDHGMPEDQIVNLVKSPEACNPDSSNERLFLDFYIKALSLSEDPKKIKSQLLLVHKAQIDSVRQTNSSISNDEIWEITCNKGGNSVLFYRTGFDHLLKKGEKECLYQLGSLMQFENDVFDVYKDHKGGICTMPIRNQNTSELRNQYNRLLDGFIELSYAMQYSENQIVRFLDIVMPVINRGFVCIDQYQKLEKKTGGMFNVEYYTRKELICDMEKPQNLFRTLYYQVHNHY
jgi:hypothetical protein